MKAYECKVRLKGSPLHEVHKRPVSQAEMLVLKRIHGDDAVLEVKDAGELSRTPGGDPKQWTLAEENDWLLRMYGQSSNPATAAA